MALTTEEQRKVYLYLRVQQVKAAGEFSGPVPVVTPTTHRLQAALDNVTPNGETTVRNLLGTMDTLYADLPGARGRFKASKVGSIELNPKEWDQRLLQFRFYQEQLDATLFPAGDGVLCEHEQGWREP